MQNNKKKRYFLKNEQAISEEFTALPALAIVMLGFTLFLLLLAQTYHAYELRRESINSFHTADFLIKKLISPQYEYSSQAGIIDLSKFNSSVIKEQINQTRRSVRAYGIDFMVRLRWDNGVLDSPIPPAQNATRFAVSHEVSIKLNEVQTVPGVITIIIWRV